MSYRIKGNRCNHLAGEPCTRCWAEWQRSPRSGATVSFPEDLMMEHAFSPWEAVRPVSSRAELRDLCEAQGVTSHYLRDSVVWPTGPRRWI